jgi:Flp pilus assembly CpaF family ATPase
MIRKERYLILSERWRDKWSISPSKNGKIINNFQCNNAEYDAVIKQIEKSIKGVGEYRELIATTKVMEQMV